MMDKQFTRFRINQSLKREKFSHFGKLLDQLKKTLTGKLVNSPVIFSRTLQRNNNVAFFQDRGELERKSYNYTLFLANCRHNDDYIVLGELVGGAMFCQIASKDLLNITLLDVVIGVFVGDYTFNQQIYYKFIQNCCKKEVRDKILPRKKLIKYLFSSMLTYLQLKSQLLINVNSINM